MSTMAPTSQPVEVLQTKTESTESRRLMVSTWHLKPDIKNSKNPLDIIAYESLYKGPQVPREGKIGVHSEWAQRTCGDIKQFFSY